MPTLLSMMGLPVPGKIEGVDLSHCACGKPGPEPEAAFMQCTGAVASWEDGHVEVPLQETLAAYNIDEDRIYLTGNQPG